MSAIQIADDVYWVGVKDPDLRTFDIVMETKHGTTYNAYLVKGRRVALIDTVKQQFADDFLANVRQIVPVEEIDYLVVNHTEPDHSGAVLALLGENPDIKLICAAPAVPFVQNIINAEADVTGVKDDHVIDLEGKTLRFKTMPYMHWPDTMMEFLAEDGVLFSNDGFAAHVAADSIFADELSVDLDHEVHYYWDVIMRPFSGFVRRNLAKLDGLDAGILAASHGPVYRTDARRYIEKYRQWSADRASGGNRVAVFYASNYGNTGRLAETMADHLQKHGFEISLADLTTCPADDARDMIEASRAVVIGTPTFNGDAVKPTWDLLNLFSTVDRTGKKAAVIGSYGWGGEGIKLVAERLAGLKLKVFEENYRARLVPSEDDMAALSEYASRVAQFFTEGK
ncbi:MAG TPA: FprA family A-type flavoprotein [Acidobacteriota bacterium]|nr:FprA family A-type flavoprotein [Acidobacteriota bacterium]